MAKIVLYLEQDDGFPPIKVEILNATRLENGLFKIQNAPFFAANVAYGDVVKASPAESPEQYEFERVVEQSQFMFAVDHHHGREHGHVPDGSVQGSSLRHRIW